MAHAQCMLDTKDYKHTLRMCNIYSFWTATVATRTRLFCVYTYIACLVNLTIPSVTHGRSLACSIRRLDDCGSGAVDVGVACSKYCVGVCLRVPRIYTQSVGRNSLIGTRFEQGTHRITEVLTAWNVAYLLDSYGVERDQCSAPDECGLSRRVH